MRTFVALFVAALALPLAAAAAHPGGHSSLTLTTASPRSLYGHAVILSGRLSGELSAGRPVIVEATPYGGAPHRLAAVTTGPGGTWQLAVRPRIQTTYLASAAGAASARLTLGVEPRIAYSTLRHDRLRVHVDAATPLARRLVQLQAQNADGSWTTIAREHLDRASTATLAPPARPTLVRLAMSVNQAGAGYLGATTAPFVYPAPPVTLATTARTVLFGHRVTLSGRVASGRAGAYVGITAHPYGRPAFTIAHLQTGRRGTFRFIVNPTIMTLYQARIRGGRSSLVVAVDVRPTITVHQLASGRVQAHVLSAAFLYGRSVQLQLLANDAWKTVAKRRLDGTSSAVFAYKLAPRSTFRVAMSVNQAGSGYVGSVSHRVQYRSV